MTRTTMTPRTIQPVDMEMLLMGQEKGASKASVHQPPTRWVSAWSAARRQKFKHNYWKPLTFLHDGVAPVPASGASVARLVAARSFRECEAVGRAEPGRDLRLA